MAAKYGPRTIINLIPANGIKCLELVSKRVKEGEIEYFITEVEDRNLIGWALVEERRIEEPEKRRTEILPAIATNHGVELLTELNSQLRSAIFAPAEEVESIREAWKKDNEEQKLKACSRHLAKVFDTKPARKRLASWRDQFRLPLLPEEDLATP